jgi:hypothetical protein
VGMLLKYLDEENEKIKLLNAQRRG